MGDTYWGTGLNIAQTNKCLSDYWPGQNVLGQILMELRDEFHASSLPPVEEDSGQDKDSKKHKASSLLANDSKVVRA